LKFINKQEAKYLLGAGIFLLVFFLIFIPNFYSIDMSPILAFILFNAFVVIFLQFFLKFVVTSKKPTIQMALGIMFIILGFSIISPPLSVNIQGVTNTSMFLGIASIDYNISLLWSSIGISGFLLYFMTYIFSSLLCFFLAGVFIKNFLNEVDQ
jgi:hypothetical protein